MNRFEIYANAYEVITPDKSYLFKNENGNFVVTTEKEYKGEKMWSSPSPREECKSIPIDVFKSFLFNYSNRIEQKNRGAMLTFVESLGGSEEAMKARKSMVNQLIFNPYNSIDNV